jgi:hypothetical protein
MTQHDQLFKHLLQVLFVDFLEGFVPELSRDLDHKCIQFLDKELIRARGRHRRTKLVDLVARVRFRGQASFVLVHLEHQSRRASDTARRLFLYAAWLMDRYNLPVYPILLTSYDHPRSPEPDCFIMQVRGLRVVDFRFRVVQLNRLNWRDYIRSNNPAAAALMAKMNVRTEERVRVKLQILRLIATLRLDARKMDLIAGFMESYLALTKKEELAFSRELDKIGETEQKAKVMELITSWERKGRQEGHQEGRQEGRQEGWQEGQLAMVKRLLRHRLGVVNPATAKHLNSLNSGQLEQLAEALLEFRNIKDLQHWLARHRRAETA